jgi:aryl-alcohol dehydrogenase-like predicted oxidoreductase
MMQKPAWTVLAPGLEVSRLIIGLWQIADMERDGRKLDLDSLAREMAAYADAGFDTFDMADHYGSAEEIAGRFNALRKGKTAAKHGALFTKWCPTPEPIDGATVRAAVTRAQERMRTPKIDLMQLHWWAFQHPGWIDALKELRSLRDEGAIGHLGTTNFDTDHLRLLINHGIPVVTNQVCFSLLDRRAAGRMSDLCRETGVRLLAYGTLGGGLLTEKWHGKPLPETLGAIGAGLILGTIAMRTKSIWGGVLIHVGVAMTMDVFALHGCPPIGSNRWCGY